MSTEPQGTAPEGASSPPATLPDVAVMPVTGEVLDLAGPTDELVDWRVRTVEIRRQLEALASDLDMELARRIDFESAGRTARVGDYQIEVQAPTTTEWDVPRLGIALEALVADARISPAVAEKAFRVTVTRAPAAAHLKKLLGHADPEVRESIARCRETVERRRRRVDVRLAHDK